MNEWDRSDQSDRFAWKLALFIVLVALTPGFGASARAATRTFVLSGEAIEFTDVTDQCEVRFSSMRWNRARDAWQVEVRVLNRGAEALGPRLLLAVEASSGTSGLLDGDHAPGAAGEWPFWDLTSSIEGPALAGSAMTRPRTVTLGRLGDAAPMLTTRVFVESGRPAGGSPVAVTQTLDAGGQPLPGVRIDEMGPRGVSERWSDPGAGIATLGGTTGAHRWRFLKPGYLPVWRSDVLDSGVRRLVRPRLSPRSEHTFVIGPQGGGVQIPDVLQVGVPPGTTAGGTGTVTVLEPQALPYPLPVGWAPQRAWWIELDRVLTTPLTVLARPAAAIPVGHPVVFARLDTNTLTWVALEILQGSETDWFWLSVDRPGAYSVVVPDGPPTAPPAAVVGSALRPAPASAVDADLLTASGEVIPPVSLASTNPVEVTARARLRVTHTGDALPSGTVLEAVIRESYRLSDGTERTPPPYVTTLALYRHPGETNVARVGADFPLRPLLLLDGTQLTEARIIAEVRPVTSFEGAILGSDQSEARLGNWRIGRSAAGAAVPQSAELTPLPRRDTGEAALSSLLRRDGRTTASPANPDAPVILEAFELAVGDSGPSRLELTPETVPADGHYVIARAWYHRDHAGLEPVARIAVQNGVWSHREPEDGTGLRGFDQSGQYALVRVGTSQGIVEGTVLNAAGSPLSSVPVFLKSQPWGVLTDESGRFRTLAAAGEEVLLTRDPASGELAQRSFVMPPSLRVSGVDVMAENAAPFVLAVSPADGASDVPLLEPVVVTFSKPIIPPASGAGVTLLDAQSNGVPARVELEPGGTALRLISSNQLAELTRYTVRVSTEVTDRSGTPLGGPTDFSFTTLTNIPPRREGAQLYSEAPDAEGMVRVIGTAGMAPPRREVVFVNDTTGRTSTLLANEDGSFTNMIPAEVNDRIRIVFSNPDGSRSEIPVGRQVFPDGSVALYSQGGAITNENAELRVILEVPPGAIPGRTRFKLQPLEVANLPALTSNTPPERSSVFGIFDLEVEGDPVRGKVNFTFTADTSRIEVPPGRSLDDIALTVGAFREFEELTVDGPRRVPVYQHLGLLQRATNAAARAKAGVRAGGLFAAFFAQVDPVGARLLLFGQPYYANTELIGLVVSAIGTGGTSFDEDTDVVLPGAIVRARAGSGYLNRPFTLQPGEAVTVSDGNGLYAFLVPAQPSGGHSLNATHPNFPGQIATSGAGARFDPAHPFGGGKIIFDRRRPPDTEPPAITILQDPTSPGAGEKVTLAITATDGSGPPNVLVSLESFSPLDGTPILLPDGSDRWALYFDRPGKVVIKVSATDTFGNQRERIHPVTIGQPEPTGTLADDPLGPRVIFSDPDTDSLGVPTTTSIFLQFNEPMHGNLTNAPSTYLTLSPDGGSPVARFGRDPSELIIHYAGLRADTEYSLTVQSAMDANGQLLDQDPDPASPPAEPFLLRFRTARETRSPLGNIGDGRGVVVRGAYAYVADRASQKLTAFDISIPAEPHQVGEVSLPGPPHTLALIPDYSFALDFRTPGVPGDQPPETPERADLLAVAGASTAGMYVRVYDLRRPLGPGSFIGFGILDLGEHAMITRLVWSPPYLAAVQNVADAPSIHVLNLQGFLLGDAYRTFLEDNVTAVYDESIIPRVSVPGQDANGDGDFVDPGDLLPRLGRDLFDFTPGFVDILTLGPNRNGPGGGLLTLNGSDRFIADAIVDGGNGFVGVLVAGGHETEVEYDTQGRPVSTNRLYKPAEFRGMLARQLLPDTNRVVFPGYYPKRAQAVTIGGRRYALLNLITADAVSNRLAVVDISVPTAIRLVNEIPLSRTEFGLVQGAEWTGTGEIAVSVVTELGDERYVLLDPARLLEPSVLLERHPAIQGTMDGAGGGVTPFAVLRHGTSVSSLRSRNHVAQSAPLVRLVRANTNWVDPFGPHDLAMRVEELRALADPDFLVTAHHGTNSTLLPGDPSVHYQVLAEIPGGAGREVSVALLSLDASGRLVQRPAGALPPPLVDAMPLRRLSDDPRMEAFNLYLSRPVALASQELTSADIGVIYAAHPRHLLYAGQRLRLGFPETLRSNPVLGPFAGEGMVARAGDTNAPPVRLGVSLARPVFNPEPLLVADDTIFIRTTADRLNTNVCPGSALLHFTTLPGARITLTIDGATAGSVTDDLGRMHQTLSDVSFPAGDHWLLLDSEHAGAPGEHVFELRGSGFEGLAPDVERVVTGTLHHEIEVHQHYPVGHTVIQGVDLWDGHLTHTRQDVFVPGRRLSLDFSRSYSSSGNSSAGPLGAGWTHSYHVRLVLRCGVWTVIGGEGTGNAFTDPRPDTVKAARYAPLLPAPTGEFEFFTPQPGYHSVLVRDTGTPTHAWYFSKSAVRYEFQSEPSLSTPDTTVFVLREIREPNGNALRLDYGADGNPTTLDSVMEVDRNGLPMRGFRFEYQNVHSEPRVVSLHGFNQQGSEDLMGLEVRFTYDDFANLTRVVRVGPTPEETRVESYTYTPGNGPTGHNLLTFTDPNGSVTTYAYGSPGLTGYYELGIPLEDLPPHEVVMSVTRSGAARPGFAATDDVVTRFRYDWDGFLRHVSDPRTTEDEGGPIPDTEYELNTYGATVRITAPLGQETLMRWATDHLDGSVRNAAGAAVHDVLMTYKRDAEGREHFFEYHDGRGNLTAERIRLPSGKAPVHDAAGAEVSEIVETSSYDALFNARTNHVDAEGRVTRNVIDPATGNLRFVIDAEGNRTELVYRPNGDLERRIDPRGFVTEYERYDLYGNAELIRTEVERGGRAIETVHVFDERSRVVETRDSFGHHTRYAYDSLDRRRREERLNDLSSSDAGPDAILLTSYLPGGEVLVETNSLGLVTRCHYDALNREVMVVLENVLQADGGTVSYTNAIGYDAAGNRVLERDARGVEYRHAHDALNRRVRTEVTGPHGGPFKSNPIVATMTYDRVNNLLSETDLHGYVTTYRHDGLYRVVETTLPFPNAIVRKRYDRVGNVTFVTDANGNPTRSRYDGLNRLVYTIDPEGNESEFGYDPVGNRTNSVLRSSGLVTVARFDGLNRPVEVTQTGPGLPTEGYTTVTLYEDSRNEQIVVSPRGIRTRNLKDGLDRVVEVVVDDGGLNLTTRFTYDAAGNVLTVVDPQNGDVDSTSTYDQLNRKLAMVHVTTPSDGGATVSETFTYDASGNITHSIDRRGIERRMTFDNLNRPLTTELKEDISNSGAWLMVQEYRYDDAARRTTAFDANRNQTVTEHDELGRAMWVINALGQEMTMTYDGVNLISETDRKGFRRTFTYDGLNRLLTTVEHDLSGAERSSLAVEYLDRSRQEIHTDRRGLKTRRTTDALGREILRERIGGDLLARYGADPLILQRLEYDGHNNLVRITDADGRIVEHQYDAADRRIATIEAPGTPAEARTTFTHDAVGNPLTIKDARAHGGAFDVRYTYDARYRRVTAENALGEITRYLYDAADHLTEMIEPLGYVTRYGYDELDFLLFVDETLRASSGDAGVTRFRSDPNRNLIAHQDPNGNLVTFRYDALNRPVARLQHTAPGLLSGTPSRGAPAGGDEATALVWTYAYDENDNRQLIVDARGQRVELSHDWLNRLTSRVYSNHAETNSAGELLDYQPVRIEYDYDGNGNPTNIVESKALRGAVVTERTVAEYDALDRLISRRRFDHDDPAGRVLRFKYDRAGNRTEVEDPDGRVTEYAFDARSRLQSAIFQPGGLTARYTWEADNLLRRLDFPGGGYTVRTYDPADRVLSITNAHSGGELFSAFAYAYDANGNRTNLIERLPGLSAATDITHYSYDRLNRVTRIGYGNGAVMEYSYAPNGNRLSERGTDPVTGAPVDRVLHYSRQSARPQTTFSGVNTLTRIEDRTPAAAHIDYEYDRNLNQIRRIQGSSVSTYHFGIRDEMLSAGTPAGAARFDYDADLLRVKKVNPDPGPGERAETRYLHDQESVLIEYGGANASHATLQKYDYGHELLALGIAGAGGSLERGFYFTDALGSVVNIASTSGVATHHYRYDAWGRIRASTGGDENRRQYTGHYRDAETGLHYFGARYYDDEQGRFLSQDPYPGEVDAPPSLHRYLYANANPLRYIDLQGYKAVPTFTDADIARYDRAAKAKPVTRNRRKVHPKDVDATRRNTHIVGTTRSGEEVNVDAWWSDRRVIEENRRDLARPKKAVQEMIAPLEAQVARIEAAGARFDHWFIHERPAELRAIREANRPSAFTQFAAGIGTFAIRTAGETSMAMWRAYNREGGGFTGYYASAMELNPSYHALVAASAAYDATESTLEATLAFVNTFNPIDQGQRAGLEMYYAFDRGDFHAAGEQALPLVGAISGTYGLTRFTLRSRTAVVQEARQIIADTLEGHQAKLQGVERTVFQGHGGYIPGSGAVKIPPGTLVATYGPPGAKITDALGNAIELDKPLTPQKVYLPGQYMPNYVLAPGAGLNMRGAHVRVSQPTLLRDLLKPNMGECHWAACMSSPFSKHVVYHYNHPQLLQYRVPRPPARISAGAAAAPFWYGNQNKKSEGK